MADEKKKRFRASLEERRRDPKRVFSFKFTQSDERHQKARKILEDWEAEFVKEHGIESPLAEIITLIILEREYGAPQPMVSEKRMLDLVLKRMGSMEEMLKDIYERDPVIVQGAINAYKERNGEDEIEDDFIGGMLGDFDNIEGRKE
jgi:hypothetical protein